ncbi:MAG: tetratricopeptide repeat protein [Methylophilaceae bacterium]
MAKPPHLFHKSHTKPQHNVLALLQQAVALHNQGKAAEAEALYTQVLQVQPHNFDALHLLGLLASQTGRLALAVDLMRRAVNINGKEINALFNLANALQGLQQHEEALKNYERLLKLRPDFFQAINNLAISQQALGRNAEALASFERGIKLKPKEPFFHKNRGDVLRILQRHDEALVSYKTALEMSPDDISTLNNYGAVLQAARQHEAALVSFSHILSLSPHDIPALHNRGNALRSLRRYQEALASYDAALALKPDFVDAYASRAEALLDIGEQQAALASFNAALQLNPQSLTLKLKCLLAHVPVFAQSAEQVAHARTQFGHELASLQASLTSHICDDETAIVGEILPFFLAYQADNNRALLETFGKLSCELMARWQTRQGLTPHWLPPSAQAPIRVGIVSAHIRRHSVWDAIVKGWFEQLDKSRFELHVFYVDAAQDQETAIAKSNAASFEGGVKTTADWAKIILAKNVDVLIYPEVGMDPTTFRLASMRIAPIQMATWGHPETTGLPTIDYYLSAENFEGAEAQKYYSEQLICLPNLGCYYSAEEIVFQSVDLSSLDIDPEKPLMICPGTPFKYAPQHDHVFVDIARELDDVQFVFFTYHRIPELSHKLARRLATSFAEAGMAYEKHVRFISWKTPAEFHFLMKNAHVMLDTIGFSGFNTAMQAIVCHTPVVAYQGQFMRGQLASGILKQLGMQAYIATNKQEYVECAVRLATDAAFADQARQKLQASVHTLYQDISVIKALEEELGELSKKHRDTFRDS